jgi:hypothetical protein
MSTLRFKVDGLLLPLFLQPIEHLGSVPLDLVKVWATLERNQVFVFLIYLSNNRPAYYLKKKSQPELW